MSNPSNENDIHSLDENMRRDSTESKGLKWLPPLTEPSLQLSGFPWIGQDRLYRRLPVNPSHPLPDAVDRLANHTAGGQIQFQTDTKRLSIQVKLSNLANMNHMPATGQCGFDCYVGPVGNQTFFCTTKYDHTKLTYEEVLFDFTDKKMRNVTLYFPLYQGVEEVLLGFDEEATIIPPLAKEDQRKVIIYGTSITQGGCASRPGMAYSNILSRHIPLQFVNLGFSGNGRGEPELAHLCSQIDSPACFVLDYEANTRDLDLLRATLPEFIRILRNVHPTVPIVVLSKIRYAQELHNHDALRRRLNNRDFQRDWVSHLQEQGDEQIYFIDGSDLLGDQFHECSVDGVHPTDLGFLKMADSLLPFFQELLCSK